MYQRLVMIATQKFKLCQRAQQLALRSLVGDVVLVQHAGDIPLDRRGDRVEQRLVLDDVFQRYGDRITEARDVGFPLDADLVGSPAGKRSGQRQEQRGNEGDRGGQPTGRERTDHDVSPV